MAFLHISNNPTERMALVDESEVENLNLYTWRLKTHKSGARIVAKAYNPITGKATEYTLSRFISGATPLQQVEFINGDIWDNRKENLRLVELDSTSTKKSIYPQRTDKLTLEEIERLIAELNS